MKAALSQLETMARGDGARGATSPTPAADAARTFAAARDIFLRVRAYNLGPAFDAEWDAFAYQMAGEGEVILRVAKEALAHFKSRAAEIDASVRAEEARRHAADLSQRLAASTDSARRDLVAKKYAALKDVATTLKARAAALEAVGGHFSGSIFGGSTPAFTDDEIAALCCETVDQIVNAASKLTLIADGIEMKAGDSKTQAKGKDSHG